LPTVPVRRRASDRSRLRRRAALLGAVAVLTLVLTACGAPGQVKSYNADVEANFLDACKTANDAKLTDAQATDLCTCWYNAIKTSISFDRFKKIDQSIRDAIDAGQFNNQDDFKRVAPELVDVLDNSDCAQAGPSAS
jgi:hypothetical protein